MQQKYHLLEKDKEANMQTQAILQCMLQQLVEFLQSASSVLVTLFCLGSLYSVVSVSN